MKALRYYIPALVWVLFILIVCTLPGRDIPHNGWMDRIHMDKLVHFALFGGIVFFLSLGCYRQKKYISPLTLFLFVLSAALYGLAIEFIQKYFAVDRSFDMNDVAADTLGAIAGIWIFRLVHWLFYSGREDER